MRDCVSVVTIKNVRIGNDKIGRHHLFGFNIPFIDKVFSIEIQRFAVFGPNKVVSRTVG